VDEPKLSSSLGNLSSNPPTSTLLSLVNYLCKKEVKEFYFNVENKNKKGILFCHNIIIFSEFFGSNFETKVMRKKFTAFEL